MKPWQDTYSLRQKETDRYLWTLGRYFQIAIGSMFPKSNISYPEYPFTDYRNNIPEEHDYDADASKFWAWAVVANKEFEDKQNSKS